MKEENIILTDICWTLFYSNTTYDFLGIRPSRWNTLLYKLFHYDFARARGLRQLQGLTEQQRSDKAEQFYTAYLEPRKIMPVWELLSGRDIVLVSGTLDIIARTVARHIGAKAWHATDPLKKDRVLPLYDRFDIVTDNMTDLELVKHARHATIVTYNNRPRWQRILPRDLNVTFIEAAEQRY